MGRTVYIDNDVIVSQLNSLKKDSFSFGFLCGQCSRTERDYIFYIIDGVTSKQANIESFFDSSSTSNELWAKMIEITSSLCAGVSIVGFYCRAKAETLKSPNFTLKTRRLFDILQSALRTYSPWSLSQSSHRILLQSELGAGSNRWLVKTMDMSAENVHFRPVEMKTYDSKVQTSWCLTTIIPIQFHVWLGKLDIQQEKNVKLIENQFEDQWRQYTDYLKESLLLMNDRLVPLGSFKLPSRSSEASIDIEWLAPVDGYSFNQEIKENNACYKFDGSASLRFFTRQNELTGHDLRQYFIEDLFRSMLIRLNLTLINNETTDTMTKTVQKLVLPRRIYVNQPVFISAYQLTHEPLSMAIESLQENFKMTSLLEEDLEAAEEFPPEVTTNERLKQFNDQLGISSPDQSGTIENERSSSSSNIFSKFDSYLGTKNTLLIALLVLMFAVILGAMLKMF